MSITVTAVIPAYNAEKYVGRAIESVLVQTRQADEIIVVDDGSTDNTSQVVEQFGDKVIFIRQENAGASVARNTGIEAATSEWIAFLDADDEWLPDKLKLQIEHLQRNPDLAWTTANYVRCFCDSDKKQDDLTGERLTNVKAILGNKEYFKSYFQAYINSAKGHTNTMMIKKELLKKAGLFLPSQFRINDYDMWLRVSYTDCSLGFLYEILAVQHRDTPDSIVKKYKDPEIISEFIDRHLKLSREHGFIKEFEPCAAQMLGWWMHTYIIDRKGKVVRQLLGRFGNLYPFYFRVTTYIKTFFPRLGIWYDTTKSRMSSSQNKA